MWGRVKALYRNPAVPRDWVDEEGWGANLSLLTVPGAAHVKGQIRSDSDVRVDGNSRRADGGRGLGRFSGLPRGK